MIIPYLLAILSSLLSTPEVAWGANGHRIIAQICEWHLSDAARQEVKEILGKEYLAEAATWPDYIRSESGWKFADPWHYTTVQPDQEIQDVRNQYAEDSQINDATEAIDLMVAVLKGDAAAVEYFENLMEKNRAKPLNGSTKATAIAFLVHVLGDIHMPLHVGKNRDLGGNKVSVLFFDERKNLHGIWDTDIIEHERLSYTEFAVFINKLEQKEIADYQSATIDDVAEESIRIREDIYNSLYDYTDRDSGLPSFSWRYQHDNLPIVEKRLVQAGVRLAGLLNEIYQ